MPPVPDPSSTPPSRAVADVEAGLAALKQGNYARAIALLETTRLPATHPLAMRSQMGLVIAYARNGDAVRAIELCQRLNQSENSQVRQWAAETLTSLAKRYPQLQTETAGTEGVQQNSNLQSSERAVEGWNTLARQENQSEVDLTGFVPLDQEVPTKAAVEGDVTGFVPIDSVAQARLDQGWNVETGNPSQPSQPPSGSQRSTQPRMTRRPGKREVLGQPVSAANQDLLSDAGDALVQPPTFEPTWRNAGRAARGQSLGKVKVARFVLAQFATAIVLFWMVQTILFSSLSTLSSGLSRISFLQVRYTMGEPPTWSLLIGLIIVFLASRWILDALLRSAYGLQPFSLNQLLIYSPEAAQSLPRFCRQRRLPLPALGVLPTAEPIAFSYGCLPRVTRIVVSQGLLEQLAEDEIAAVYANEVGHLVYWDVPLMSLVAVLTQVPYTLYWMTAEWGNRKQAAITKASATLISAVSYGVYSLLRWVALWLSRQRVYFSDRVATELTGNPNGYTRALLKMAIGTAQQVQAQGRTSYLLEGLDVLTPLSHRVATPLGSIYPFTPLEPVLAWDWINPFRHWLSLNQAHPPTGDRLHLLSLYARHWKLEPELSLDQEQRAVNRKTGLTGQQWQTLLLQGAPFFGLGIGFAIAWLCAFLGWAGWRLNFPQLAWMYGDTSLRSGLPLVGFSLGTFLRINPFFPDIKFFGTQTAEPFPTLAELLRQPTAVPIDSLPIRLEGKLLGRVGISNDLSQDLLLQTATGIVRLHCLSRWGPIGNLFPQEVRPTDLLNQNLLVTGWFRRGTTPWIDVETLRTTGGRTHRSYHPVWSTILAIITAVWGILTIAGGGIF